MLESLQRFIRRKQAPADPEAALMSDWARQHGDKFKRVRRGQGAVIGAHCEAGPMRIEWGPSQRPYIAQHEMRVRIEAQLPDALEMLLLSRSLADALEAQAFEQLTSLQQTEIDGSSPEELRWLSSFERIRMDEVPGFAQSFVLVSSAPSHARHWAAGELAVRALRARTRWLGPHAPLVLMTLRGRVYLRTEADSFDETLLDGVRSLAETAALRARKISSRSGRLEVSQQAEARRNARAALLAEQGGARPNLIRSLNAVESGESIQAYELDGLDELEEADGADLPSRLPPLGSDVATDLPL
jgi:hypothetical protein